MDEDEDEHEDSESSEGMDVEDAADASREEANGLHRQNKILYSHEGQYNPKLAKSLKKKRKKAKKMETDDYDFEEDWGMES